MKKATPKNGYRETYPEQFDAPHKLGILKARSSLCEEALDLFNAALKINPDRRKRT